MDVIEYNHLRLKKATIISRQILLYFCDFFRYVLPIFDKARVYRIPFQEYDRFREDDRIKFNREIYRLKRNGMIKKYLDEKGAYLEITPKGKKYLKRYLIEELILKKAAKWDKKWRLVIFDVPNDKKNERDILRNKLIRLGFLKLQESVYVYPFECFTEINLIKSLYFLGPYVQYIVAERVETEINLLNKFVEKEILNSNNI